MPKQSNFNLRQFFLIGSMIIGFLGFAVLPLLKLFDGSNVTSAPQNDPKSEKESLSKLIQEEKVYQTILSREPKNIFALQNITNVRIKMFKVTGENVYLQKTLPPLGELIKQNPQDKTLVALKKQIEMIVNKDNGKPTS